MSIEKINKILDDSKDEMIALLKELIQADTTNLPGNEYLGVEIIQKFLEKYSIPYEIHSQQKGRENIIIRIGEGDKKLFSAGHIDIVPVGDLETWDHPPLEGHIVGTKMYGRGTTDNKGPLVALLMTVKALWPFRAELNGTFIAAGVADEEKGSVYGTEFLMEEGLIDADWAIIPDIGGNMMAIDVAEKGVLDLEILTKGISAHGSTPERGVNAIEKMAEVIRILKKHTFSFDAHNFLSPPTMNIGVVNGGSASNMVPDKCRLIVNVRYLPSQKAEILKDDLALALASVKDTEISIIHNLNPTEVDPENVLVGAIQEETKRITSKTPQLIGLGGATVCKTFIEKGIPAVGWSPGPDDVAHIANEYIDLDEMLDFSKIMAGVVKNLLK